MVISPNANIKNNLDFRRFLLIWDLEDTEQEKVYARISLENHEGIILLCILILLRPNL